MVSSCAVMVQFTRSPIETMPTTSSPSSTGRWRMSIFGHRPQAFFHSVVGTRGDHAVGHNLPHLGFLRRTVLQNHFACVIALGNNAGQTAFRQDHQGPHALFGHTRDRFINGCRRGDRPHLAAFESQHRIQSIQWLHDMLPRGHHSPGCHLKQGPRRTNLIRYGRRACRTMRCAVAGRLGIVRDHQDGLAQAQSFRSRNNPSTAFEFSVSRLPVGSSASNMAG